MSRGLRNCNPGNIRSSGVLYLGEVRPSKDREFKQFRTMAWGYRALFALLQSYALRYRLTTLRGIVARYAPPSENDTGAYLDALCRWTGFGPDEAVDHRDRDAMVAVASAVSRMENGVAAVADEVAEGWRLFLLYRP